ncbi:MAG: glucose-1-phosphate thymidylyltransferase [Deltaproteobacteria bacterium]|nr:glucose-1-phosphate thymidylyltransferase [Deltaproteobacteria bacterium]MCL5277724.1 glucose-1-phosphate thymidylyltransferase [Deltaproteobacteria bacterium]
MKALILSGGKGTRLRPITHTSAKQLLPVANKPILFYAIEAIRDSGIRDIGIIVGDTAEEVRNAVSDGRRFGVEVTYIQQDEPLGLAHAVLIARDFLKDEPFVMYLGDNLIKGGITGLVEQFKQQSPNSQILLAHVRNPSQFGVAELRDSQVVRLEEKPASPKSDLALVGVYMFDKNIHAAVRAIRPSKRGELEITDAIQWLIDNDLRVLPHIVTGWWKDTGRLEDMLEANRMMLDTYETDVRGDVDEHSRVEFKVVVEKGAVVRHSTIRGPAAIGSGAKIINSYIGPFTSISSDTQIINSEIEHSIILENCLIEDVGIKIEDSLVGRNAEVKRLNEKPRVYRLLLGDNSKVGLP